MSTILSKECLHDNQSSPDSFYYEKFTYPPMGGAPLRNWQNINIMRLGPVAVLQGGGTRLKILEAFAAGLPVVSTSKGAEGLSVKDGEHLLIADSAEALAASGQQLWTDPALAQRLSQAAYELVKREYSWDRVSQTVKHITQPLL